VYNIKYNILILGTLLHCIFVYVCVLIFRSFGEQYIILAIINLKFIVFGAVFVDSKKENEELQNSEYNIFAAILFKI